MLGAGAQRDVRRVARGRRLRAVVLLALFLAHWRSALADGGCIRIVDPPHSAVCDDVADDTTAWLSAVAQAQAEGGRCVQFPAGTCYMTGGATWFLNGSDDQVIIVRGTGTASKVRYRGQGAWLVVGNYAEARIEDLAFVGTDGVPVDGMYLIYAMGGRKFVMRSVQVHGFAASVNVVWSGADYTVLERTGFLGCSAPSGGVVEYASSIRIDEGRFIDFGNLGGVVRSKGYSAAWVRARMLIPIDYKGESGPASHEISRTRFDENALVHVDFPSLPAGYRYGPVRLFANVHYPSGLPGAVGVSVSSAEKVELDMVKFHTRGVPGNIDVRLLDAGDVELRFSRFGRADAQPPTVAGRVYVDAATRWARSLRTDVGSWECSAQTCVVE